MRAIRKIESGVARLIDVRTPICKAGELLLQPTYSGICASDLHVLYHGFGAEGPLTMGHEFSAVVVEIGSDAGNYLFSDNKVRVGDRVTVEPFIPCRKCKLCLQGRTNLCPYMTHLGIFQDGCYADFVKAPIQQVHPLPKMVSDKAGSLIEPLACALNIIDKTMIKPGQSVTILGGGAIGLMTLLLAKAAGAGFILVSEPVLSKRELALKLGSDEVADPLSEQLTAKIMDLTGEPGTDVVIDCAGVSTAIAQIPHIVRRGGRCVLAGLPMKPITLDLLPLVFGEIEWVGSIATAWQFPRAMRLVELGQVDVLSLIDNEVTLEESIEAMRMVHENNQTGKVVIRHT